MLIAKPHALIAAMLALQAPHPAAAAHDQTAAERKPEQDENVQHQKISDQCKQNDDEILRDTSNFEPRDATEMVGLYPCWLADEDNGSWRDLSDLYAHWSLRQIRSPKGTPRGYRYEARDKIVRIFVGRDFSMLSTIKIEMHNPDTTIVIPLTHFSYQGRAGKPELWTTELVGDDQSTPFFRIQPETSATIFLKASATTRIEAQAAGTVLDALTRIASIASPGAALLTTLNKEPIQQTSRTLDTALSNIWSDAKGEAQVSGRALSEWYPGARYILKVTAPGWVRPAQYDRTKPKDKQIFTRWYELTLSCPRRSIFNGAQDCKAGYPGSGNDQNKFLAFAQTEYEQGANDLYALRLRISPEHVLNYRLSTGRKLQEHLASFDWYGRFLRLAGTPKAGTSEAASTKPTKPTAVVGPVGLTNGIFEARKAVPPEPAAAPAKEPVPSRTEQDFAALCTSIVSELYAIGLSQTDARIGLWAVISASSDFVGTVAEFQNNPSCTDLLPLRGNGGWALLLPPANIGLDGAEPPHTPVKRSPGRARPNGRRRPPVR